MSAPGFRQAVFDLLPCGPVHQGVARLVEGIEDYAVQFASTVCISVWIARFAYGLWVGCVLHVSQ